MGSSEIESKEKILLAAKKEFAENGYNGTKLDAVAKRAGVNKALIHYYFGNKEDLYRQVRMLVLGLGRKGEMLIYLPQMSLNPAQKLYVALYFLIKIHQKIKDRDIFRIFFWEVVENNRIHEEAMREHRVPQARLIADIIRQGIAAGDFETPDPNLFTMLVMSFLDMYVLESEFHRDGGVFRELYGDADEGAVLDFLMKAVFKGLGTAKKGAVPPIPAELLAFTDRLVENVVKNIGEGYSQAVIEKLRELLVS